MEGSRQRRVNDHWKVVPRDPHQLDRYGSSGRVRRKDHKAVPLSKKWFMAYNVRSEDDQMVESYPVGLRKKRLCLVVTLVALSFILCLITFIALMWIFASLQVDRFGLQSMIIQNDTSVGFLRTFGAENLFIAQDPGSDATHVARAPVDTDVSLNSNYEIALRSLQPTVAARSDVSITPDNMTITSHTISFLDTTFQTTPIVIDVEKINVNSRQMLIDGDLSVSPKMATSHVRSATGSALNITSPDVTMRGFQDTTAESSQTTSVSSAGNIVVNATDTLGLGYTALNFNGRVVLDTSLLSKPDNITLLGPMATYGVCSCSTGTLFLIHGNTTCNEPTVKLQYLVDPCI
eukprot:m.100247 g.100247  ORF g.100247 m.100247 type:complete len:348 (-) comp13163_c1_seq2:331-1374(-)